MDQKVAEAIKKLEAVYHVMDTIKLDGLVNQARLVGSANEIMNVVALLSQNEGPAAPAGPSAGAGEEADA